MVLGVIIDRQPRIRIFFGVLMILGSNSLFADEPLPALFQAFSGLGYDFDTDVESWEFDSNNSVIAGFREYARFILHPVNSEEKYQRVSAIHCVNRDQVKADWKCEKSDLWRIVFDTPVYLSGDREFLDMIGKEPSKALDPYHELLVRMQSVYPLDYWKQPPTSIRVQEGKRMLLYGLYGSGCQTSFDIEAHWIDEELYYSVDLEKKHSLCI